MSTASTAIPNDQTLNLEALYFQIECASKAFLNPMLLAIKWKFMED